MDKLYHYILKRATEGKIEKEDAVRMVTLLRQTQAEQEETRKEDIAIIGMSSHIAGTESPEEFWRNIEAGIDLTGSFPQERSADIESYVADMLADMGWEVKYSPGAYLHDIASFDYSFFRITPNEASLMDPSQRVFLQTAWEAIEDAGYGGKKLTGTQTGVYVGYSSSSLYHTMILDTDPEAAATALTGNIAAMLPTRISYMLDLKGPTLILDTACSSSSVAIHLACKAIQNGDCQMALAGGIRINLLPIDNSGLKLGVEAADGRTRTFDAEAEGAGWGEGSAAVLLKPLSKAVQDGDRIYAVIKGTAVNQDGASIGITAPNANAQADVLQKAWKDAGIHPETLSYIEVHGTATRLGDPLEIEGLYKAFKKHTRKKQFCAVSTLKTNVGHLYECAGIAGVIKAALSLKHRKLPAALNFNRPNATIGFSESPVYVNTHTRDWDAGDHPRRCGISAFGLSGTNCHIVLEEYAPEQQTDREDEEPRILPNLLTISAKSKASLSGIVNRYEQLLNREAIAAASLRDLCYTANTGRGHYAHRIAVTFEDEADLRQKITLLAGSSLEELSHDDIRYGRHKVVSGNKQQLEDGEIKEAKRAELTRKSSEKIVQLAGVGNTEKQLLNEIGNLYVCGADVNWEELYSGESRSKTHVPVYAFEKHHCWLDLPEPGSRIKAEEPLFYEMRWRKCERIPEAAGTNGAAIILMDSTGIGENIAATFREGGRQVIEVELVKLPETAGSPACIPTREGYRIDGSKESYVQLIQALKHVAPSQIVHLFSLDKQEASDSLETLKQRQQRGAYSLFYLTRALSEGDNSLALHILTRNTIQASGEEGLLNPDHAPVHGMGKVIPKELPGVFCKMIDLDDNVPIELLLRELQAADGAYSVALRGNDRYIEVFSELAGMTGDSGSLTLKENGVYLITGGLGGIGLEMAKWFAASASGKVNLALINRTPLPPRAQWQTIVDDSNTSDKLKKRLGSLMELETLGANVECISADVSDYDFMSQAISQLKSKYGAILGVVHGAGVSSDGPLADRSDAMFDAIYAPKVYGTWVLDALTRGEALDFFIMFSSVATIFTARGQGDYAAANAYLDAYAAYRQGRAGRTLTVNWTTWKETGMAFDGGHVFDTIFKTLPTDQGLEGLSLLLRHNSSRALIGQVHYDGAGAMLLERSGVACSDSIRQRIAAKKEQKKKPSGGGAQKSTRSADGVTLLGRGEGPYSELEQKLALCCKHVFGYEEIDIYDNFFEMGADSLVLMKLQGEIETHTFEAVQMSELFEHTTVAQLAEHLSNQAAGKEPARFYSYPPMQKAEDKPYYPASHAQRRMFLAFKRQPQNTSNNQFRVSLLNIRIEPERMELAVRRLIDRHEVLRTAVTSMDGEIVQLIRDQADFQLAYWQADEEEAQEIIYRFRQPFDLNAPPLFRLGLVKVEEDKYYLLYDAHHIITDGISMEIFMRELIQLYKGEALPALAYQYKDAVEWQLSLLHSEGMKHQQEFWQHAFADGIPTLQLPLDFGRPEQLAFESGLTLRLADRELTDKLKKLAGSTGTTMYMLLLAAYALLLSKYTAQDDLVIGSPVTGRPRREMDKIVGMFINMIAMRVKPQRELTFLNCLEQVKASAVLAFNNQDYPLDELIYQLDVQRTPNRRLVFDTVFIYQNIQVEERSIGRSLEHIYNLTDYDLTLEAMDKGGQLQLRLEYNTLLFRPQTAERMLEDYLSILVSIAAAPQTRLQDIELASLGALNPAYEEDEEISFNL
ncbi:SDR family NAD(P)-dependent oxidoreductase [Paenibacillus sp. GCM10012307]|uniref:SDR family NAD(P)-dependent oxidoreductase n=1 Tax=Paenibacillus roseus TaxID=2798579 RepID=A0A934J6C2_9BACL|nr:SDR family NAD(P)-dependent oxidoreductase [Paenibacillus roseus]MBJ6364094.1 SDR family NAD(P)-dependent oxidoreductase [Paenibacillus roseus]